MATPEDVPPPESAAQPGETEAAPAVPDDANDLRGYHFRRLMRKQLTIVLLGLTAIAALAGLGIAVNGVVGVLAAIAVLLIGVGIVFALADARAADSFFEVYAAQHNYLLLGRSRLPTATPLLRKGDDRYATRILEGALAPGVEGRLVLYTYEETTYDGKNRTTNYYHYTLGLIEVPESVAHVPELYCQRKFGLRSLERFEDVFRGSKKRVELESEALLDKYEIFSREGEDENWLRQLFSPTFIVWLTESAPEKFAFELVGGTLCCYVSGSEETAAGLDTVAAASVAVATRLREESAEG